MLLRSAGLSPLAAMVFDIPFGREHRQQIVKLKHESDMPRSPGGELAVRQFVHALAIDANVPGWPVQPPIS